MFSISNEQKFLDVGLGNIASFTQIRDVYEYNSEAFASELINGGIKSTVQFMFIYLRRYVHIYFQKYSNLIMLILVFLFILIITARTDYLADFVI
jgi:hypothetical protein